MINVELNFTDEQAKQLLIDAGYDMFTGTFIDYQKMQHDEYHEVPRILILAIPPEDPLNEYQIETESYEWFEQRYSIPVQFRKHVISTLFNLICQNTNKG